MRLVWRNQCVRLKHSGTILTAQDLMLVSDDVIVRRISTVERAKVRKPRRVSTISALFSTLRPHPHCHYRIGKSGGMATTSKDTLPTFRYYTSPLTAAAPRTHGMARAGDSELRNREAPAGRARVSGSAFLLHNQNDQSTSFYGALHSN